MPADQGEHCCDIIVCECLNEMYYLCEEGIVLCGCDL